MRSLPHAPLACLFGTLGLAACGGLPPAPAYPKAMAAEPSGMPATTSPPQQQLSAGDTVEVRLVSVETTVASGLVVEGDGELHLPGVGSVKVAGKSLPDAEQALTQLVQAHSDRFARAFISLVGRGGQHVTVLGAVGRQGRVELVPGMRVADVIANAGGVLAVEEEPTRLLGDVFGAVLIRDGRQLPISLQRAVEGHPAHNVFSLPGDYLYVPLADHNTVAVMGQVSEPSVFAYSRGLRLTEALAIAGGVTPQGDSSDIRLVRGEAERPQVYAADLDALTEGESHDVQLEPGDFLFVTDDVAEDLGEVTALLGTLTGTVSILSTLILAFAVL